MFLKIDEFIHFHNSLEFPGILSHNHRNAHVQTDTCIFHSTFPTTECGTHEIQEIDSN